jgi:hypothetical protein
VQTIYDVLTLHIQMVANTWWYQNKKYIELGLPDW